MPWPSTRSVLNVLKSLGADSPLARLENTVRAATTTPEGRILTRSFSPEELQALNNAKVIMRRRSMSDITGPDRRFKSVHESKRTGAAAGPKASAEVRAEREPEMFGSQGQTYGYMTEDPFSTLKVPLTDYYPKKGSSFIAPENMLPQYGQYAFELHPEARSRATLTLDDSLDRTRGGSARASDLLSGVSGEYNTIGVPGSQLWELAQKYDAARRRVAESIGPHSDEWAVNDAMKAQGLPEDFRHVLREHNLGVIGNKHLYASYFARQLPRELTDLNKLPLLPTEIKHLSREPLADVLNQRNPYSYIEAQVHGDVTPDMLSRVYDLGYEPSLAAEKAAKKVGIEYVPRPRAAYDDITAANPKTRGEFYDLARDLGVITDSDRRHLLDYGPVRKFYGEARDEPMPPFGRSYVRGGLVQKYKAGGRVKKPIWDKARPKSLGASQPLSSAAKSAAKAAAKSAGRPYPNLVDNMRAAGKR